MVRWYAGYEIVSSNNVVISVKLKPVQTEAEKLEKENRSKLAEEQLRAAYEERKSREKRAKIYADGYHRSCGCSTYYCRHHPR